MCLKNEGSQSRPANKKKRRKVQIIPLKFDFIPLLFHNSNLAFCDAQNLTPESPLVFELTLNLGVTMAMTMQKRIPFFAHAVVHEFPLDASIKCISFRGGHCCLCSQKSCGKGKIRQGSYCFCAKKGAFSVNYSQKSIVISAKEFANVIGVLYNHTKAC